MEGEIQQMNGIPPAPEPFEWMRPDAKRIWFTHAPNLLRKDYLDTLSAIPFAMYCSSVADAARAAAMLEVCPKAEAHLWRRIERRARRFANRRVKDFFNELPEVAPPAITAKRQKDQTPC